MEHLWVAIWSARNHFGVMACQTYREAINDPALVWFWSDSNNIGLARSSTPSEKRASVRVDRGTDISAAE